MPCLRARFSAGASWVGLFEVVVITLNRRAIRLLNTSTWPWADAVTGPV